MKKMLTVTTLTLSLLLSGVGLAVPQHASAATTSQDDKIISTAKSYIGKVKYVYGERNPDKLIFDCSAFTQFVFKKNGISIPWGSRAQAKVGTKVSSISKLQKGDLVMFSVGTKGQINHVGIYVGNNKFISNTKSSGVVISSMTSGYWSTRFIEGRHL
ncbi:C40 family peptidase [Paenibacillus rigui]|uniref:Hydrolase Nlp/P60 n=1 Tax=Paenibacillus rigui TaxID=554312 RepID=A0A229UH34_9BACL|nr:C40 family peptidase [Paenibacillus rigui]OXM82707.1 hydrolase Nlp/P60 [Paenibacillus rigui]